jgi:hypothetical protein
MNAPVADDGTQHCTTGVGHGGQHELPCPTVPPRNVQRSAEATMVHALFALVQGTLPARPAVDLAAHRSMDFRQRPRMPDSFTMFLTH